MGKERMASYTIGANIWHLPSHFHRRHPYHVAVQAAVRAQVGQSARGANANAIVRVRAPLQQCVRHIRLVQLQVGLGVGRQVGERVDDVKVHFFEIGLSREGERKAIGHTEGRAKKIGR